MNISSKLLTLVALIGLGAMQPCRADSPRVPLDTADGRPYLHVTTPQKKKIKLLLDTGSTATVLQSLPFLRAQEAKPVGTVGCRSLVEPLPLYAGEFQLPVHQELLCPFRTFDQNGLFGIDSLANGNVVFNFREGYFQSLDALPSGLRREHFETESNGRILMNLSIDNITARASWDTGAGVGRGGDEPYSGSVDKSFVDKHPGLFAFHHLTYLTNAIGDSEAAPVYELTVPLVVNGVSLENQTFIASDFAKGGMAGFVSGQVSFILGFGAMQDHAWAFDFEHKLWSIF